MKKTYMKTYQPTLEVNGNTQKSHHHHSLEEQDLWEKKKEEKPMWDFHVRPTILVNPIENVG